MAPTPLAHAQLHAVKHTHVIVLKTLRFLLACFESAALLTVYSAAVQRLRHRESNQDSGGLHYTALAQCLSAQSTEVDRKWRALATNYAPFYPYQTMCMGVFSLDV